MDVTYSRHLTQLEKNKEWLDGRLVFKGTHVTLCDVNGYHLEVRVLIGSITNIRQHCERSNVTKDKKGRYILGKHLVDVDDSDLMAFKRWKMALQSRDGVGILQHQPSPPPPRAAAVPEASPIGPHLVQPLKLNINRTNTYLVNALTPKNVNTFKTVKSSTPKSIGSSTPVRSVKTTERSRVAASTTPKITKARQIKPRKFVFSQSDVTSRRGLVQSLRKSEKVA